MGVFVLVHGACHGAWCYSRVLDILQAQNHDVYVPSLSGVGELAHLTGQSINLSTHMRDVMDVIEQYELYDIVLCGHSYGGIVITGVAGQIGARIRALVYLDGVVPEDGQSLFDIVGPDRTLRALKAAGETGTLMASPTAEEFEVRPENKDWVDRMCTPHPVACFIQRLKYTGKESLVTCRTFVLAQRHNSSNRATFERVKNLPGWKVVSLDCGHDIMVDEPEALAAFLMREVVA